MPKQSKASEAMMAQIHSLVAQGILNSLNDGADNGTLKLAIDFLHKNNIVADLGALESDTLSIIRDNVIEITKEDMANFQDPSTVDDPEIIRERYGKIGETKDALG